MVKPTISMSSGGPRKLPPMRPDIQIFKGPRDADGAPTYNIKDPITGSFYKFNWEQSLILKHYDSDITAEELVLKLNQSTTATFSTDDIKIFLSDLAKFGLLNVPRSSEQMAEIHRAAEQGWVKWLAFHYLYIRIPLVNPDKFLQKTLPFARLLFSRLALFLYLTLAIVGVIGLFQRFDEFISTFDYFFNLKGFLVFGLVLTLIKVIHELAHAYTAKNYGIHVPTMGVVLLVFLPMLYTDVTDGWRLYKRKSRFAISVAGITAELLLAGMATFGWLFTQPGLLQSLFFVVASSTWISTLALNLNPAMRFDGYYILSDLWGIDNLQSRAFAVTRWRLHEIFLGLRVKAPEEGLSQGRIRGMMLYSIYTWIYRIFLYIAIALLVYYKFAKVLGVALFALEIAIFFIWPIYTEVKTLYNLRRGLTWNWRSAATVTGLSALILWLAIPVSRQMEFDAVIVPVGEQLLLSPRAGIIEKVFVERGAYVEVGDPIVQITDPQMDSDIRLLEIQVALQHQKLDSSNSSRLERPYLTERASELVGTTARLESLLAAKESLLIKATVSGCLHHWDEGVIPGVAVGKKQVIGMVADTDKVKAIGFVPEADLDRTQHCDTASFRVSLPRETFDGVCSQVQVVRCKKLPYIALASVYSGNLPVTQNEDRELLMVESYFPIEVALSDEAAQRLRFGQSGTLLTKSGGDSAFMRLFRRVHRVLIRESNI